MFGLLASVVLTLLRVIGWSLLVFVVGFVSLAVYGYRPVWRFRTRHIPGPPQKLLWGSIPEVHYLGAHGFQQKYAAIYGPVFKTWGFQGPEVVVTSPELIRQALWSSNVRPVLNGVASLERHTQLMRDFHQAHIMTAEGELWRSLRESFDPFFLPGSLESFGGVMNKAGSILCDRLDDAASKGELIDIHRLMCDMAMDVITQLSFGVELNIQDPENAVGPFAESVRHIHKDSTITFHGANATSWFVYTSLFPEFLWLIRKLAAWRPDPALLTYIGAQGRIIDTVKRLLDNHRAAQASGTGEAALPNGHADSLPNGHLPNGLPPKSSGLASKSSGLASKSSGPTSTLGMRPSDLVAKQGAGKRRGVTPGSFLDLLTRGTDRRTGKPLSDGTIIRQGHAMIMAGFETTATTLTTTVYNLSQNPEATEKLAQEALAQPENPTLDSVEQMPWADAVFRESLRLYPSAAVAGRQAEKDMVLGGYKIAKGTHIKCSTYTIHRDPNLWDQPTSFIPSRWLEDSPNYAGARLKDSWWSFGGGQRVCPGQRLAMEEAKIALTHVFRRFTFKLGPGQVPLALRHNLTMSPAKGVWVTVHRRQ